MISLNDAAKALLGRLPPDCHLHSRKLKCGWPVVDHEEYRLHHIQLTTVRARGIAA